VKQFFPPLAGEDTLTFTLISRRASYQAGTRYWPRGCDPDGNAANWVLTEQVIEHQADICSYVQVSKISPGAVFYPSSLAYLQFRGSVPLFWTQTPDLGVSRPAIHYPANAEVQIDCVRKHMTKMRPDYSAIKVINLLSARSNTESTLIQKFTDALAALSDPSIE